MRAGHSLVTFSFDFDTEMFTKTLETHIGAVFFVVVLFVRELWESVLGSILGAHNAWLARNRDSLAGCWFLSSIIVIILAFAFDAIDSGCCGCVTAWRRCQGPERCHVFWVVVWSEMNKMYVVRM